MIKIVIKDEEVELDTYEAFTLYEKLQKYLIDNATEVNEDGKEYYKLKEKD